MVLLRLSSFDVKYFTGTLSMILEYLFAPRDSENFPPCGMFSIEHIIALLITALCIAIGLYLSRNMTQKQIKTATKAVAITVTSLEGVKIGYNLAYDYTQLDAWFPLAFCSIFIYATWMAGFGHGFVERLGISFLVCGCPAAGTAFLIFPTTSLQLHPIYHYLCIYSMLFHGLMVYFGLLYILKGNYKPNKKMIGQYATVCAGFSAVALVLNAVFGCNMMFLREPFNFPIDLIYLIHQAGPVVYSLLIFAVYIALFFVSLFIYKLKEKILEKRTLQEATAC